MGEWLTIKSAMSRLDPYFLFASMSRLRILPLPTSQALGVNSLT